MPPRRTIGFLAAPALAAAAIAGGCGQTGPLYLPDRGPAPVSSSIPAGSSERVPEEKEKEKERRDKQASPANDTPDAPSLPDPSRPADLPEQSHEQ